jgi:hypothetical protein
MKDGRVTTAAAAVTIVTGMLIIGCSSGELETGYKPRKLGASEAERRAFYANPFTPEANAAAQDRESDLEARRPRPGY